ncbi:hypothetical protein DFS34DRAFT_600652 [Phlyctochytrium arcticum]|nr:hypothetical protein DFS34DRAFT_600652 [Phlyctochytrium arcticum]
MTTDSLGESGAKRKEQRACIASRPSKRSRGPRNNRALEGKKHLLPTGRHPLGVKPLGNYLFESLTNKECRTSGLGQFSVFSDEFLISFLADQEPELLCQLAKCSKAFYVWTYFDDLWRTLTVRDYGNGGWGDFKGSWRRTYKHKKSADRGVTISEEYADRNIKVDGIYSDYLFTSFRCASIPVSDMCSPEVDNIDRRSNLSYDDFMREYGIPNKPVIITDVVPKWPAFQKWSTEYLLQHCPDKIFRAESASIPFREYVSYAQNANEEAPLYLFDKEFHRDTTLANDYSVPEYFDEDLFSLLGETRPDFRWLIIGPERSGSTFHVDPNSTSAWNAVITGAKKWVMFPPEVTPPGVYPSSDGSEVTTPLALTEWFLNFYGEAKSQAVQPIECVCRAGEMVFVPCGWWHCVINLEPSIAITQNFVSKSNLPQVLRFLKCRRTQVSGSCYSEKLYEHFVQELERVEPGLAAEIERNEKISDADIAAKTAKDEKNQANFWSDIAPSKSSVGADSAVSENGFSFSFGD